MSHITVHYVWNGWRGFKNEAYFRVDFSQFRVYIFHIQISSRCRRIPDLLGHRSWRVFVTYTEPQVAKLLAKLRRGVSRTARGVAHLCFQILLLTCTLTKYQLKGKLRYCFILLSTFPLHACSTLLAVLRWKLMKARRVGHCFTV